MSLYVNSKKDHFGGAIFGLCFASYVNGRIGRSEINSFSARNASGRSAKCGASSCRRDWRGRWGVDLVSPELIWVGCLFLDFFSAAGFGPSFGFLVLCFPVSLIFCFSASLLLCLHCFSAFPASLLFCFSAFLRFAFPASLLFCFCFSCLSAFVLLCLSTATILLFLFFSHVFLLLYFLLLCFFASCLYRLFVFHFFCFILFCLYPKWTLERP